MALTTSEQTAVRAIIARDGGIAPVLAEITALGVADQQAAALALLTPAVSVAVTDWVALGTYVGQSGTDITLYAIMAAITAAAAAKSVTNLGPLFVALYAAVKQNYRL